MKTCLSVALALLLQVVVVEQALSICCTYKNPYYQVNIVAGQHTNVGEIDLFIAQDNGEYFLNVVYALDPDNDWYLAESHLAVVCDDPSGIPQVNGNPVPGQFPYSAQHDPYTDKEYTYIVPLDQFDGCQTLTLYIAAHAVVVMLDEYGQIVQEETAWAGCEGPCCFSFEGSNWGTYFAFGRLQNDKPGVVY